MEHNLTREKHHKILLAKEVYYVSRGLRDIALFQLPLSEIPEAIKYADESLQNAISKGFARHVGYIDNGVIFEDRDGINWHDLWVFAREAEERVKTHLDQVKHWRGNANRETMAVYAETEGLLLGYNEKYVTAYANLLRNKE